MIGAAKRRKSASRFVLRIRCVCRIQTLPDCRIRVSAGVDYQLTVDVAEVTQRNLRMEFHKFPCRPNEEFVPRYYDSNLDKFFEVETDEDLALMWGKHLGSRTMLMSYHIVNKETREETVANDFTSSSTQTTQASIQEQLPIQYDADASEKEYIEMGEGDVLAIGDEDDEKAYPDVAADPDRVVNMECYLDPNFESDNGNDEDEDADDEEMGCKNDYIDEDRPIIHFDKNNPTIDVGTVFECVEDCRYAVATFAIKVGFEYIIEKSDQKRLRVRCRDKMCKWRLHASPMRGGYPF